MKQVNKQRAISSDEDSSSFISDSSSFISYSSSFSSDSSSFGSDSSTSIKLKKLLSLKTVKVNREITPNKTRVTIQPREYKRICGVKTISGKHCRALKAIGLKTCLIHSENLDIICGAKNKSGGKCKQLKGKCKYHGSYKPIVKTIQPYCFKELANGGRCSKSSLPDSDFCWYHSLDPEIEYCGARTIYNEPCGALKGKCKYHN